MSIIKAFTQNDFGCSVVFTDDPSGKAYYVGFNDKALIADEVTQLFIEQLHGKATFPIFSESAFRNELEEKLKESYDPGEDPRTLDLPDGDAVVSMDLPPEVIYALAMEAHRLNITLNDYFVRVLQQHIAEAAAK
jgi:hypothetical protein